nr:MAG TPA: dUTPase [Caudoviricetes sp.]
MDNVLCFNSYMLVKVKKLVPEAIIPSYAKPGDAGMDLVATSVDFNNSQYIEYGTGLAIEIPKGYVGYIFPRSSNSKYDLQLCNCVGVIDSKNIK